MVVVVKATETATRLGLKYNRNTLRRQPEGVTLSASRSRGSIVASPGMLRGARGCSSF